jgi:hypothetical protein
MTVEELEERMSSAEVTEWAAVFTLEGEEIDAVRTGRPPPRAPSAPLSQDELRRKIERAFHIAA